MRPSFMFGCSEGAQPADTLNREKCLLALAHLRHAKWFQARCVYLQSCQITLRILRDIRRRIESWKPLTDWCTTCTSINDVKKDKKEGEVDGPSVSVKMEI
uniref:DZF domain-containing protein n=1 Tax=Heterorhabditis bacteriophora TaxID=37862 RepID=A0A1I7WP45_HETBA